MNFNDDPLADLLSDNSLDNDNFFETPAGVGHKKTPKIAKAKGKLEDLFGIQEETETDVQSPSTYGAKGNPTATSTPRIVKQKPSLSLDDDAGDDDLGFDPKRPKSGGAKKSLFDDLLGVAEPKKNLFDDILSGGDAAKRPATAKPSISRQSTDTTTENSQARPKTSTGRRSSAQSATINADPLGLFGRDTNATVSGMSTPVSKKRGTTADWLGLEAAAAAVEQERPSTPQQQQQLPAKEPPAPAEAAVTAPKQTADILRMPETDEPEQYLSSEQPLVPVTAVNPATQSILLLNSLNLETGSKLNALQQQEGQLVIAAQMKSQERTLLEMQRRQEAQDRKFQALIQQQLQRQQQMEEHIKGQQERISMHIQLMMAQPVHVQPLEELPAVQKPALDLQQETASREEHKEHQEQELMHQLQLETEAKRNLLEKLRLEELVANMKVNYEQEVEMIESTYKKQLKVLEEHLAAVEERLKTENSDLRQHFVDKLEQQKADYVEQLSTLRQDHEDEVRKLRNSHEMDLEGIRQAKLVELSAVQDHGNYLETLRLASSNLQELRDGMSNSQDRERLLEARERRLADQERRLKMNEETAVEEQRRLMELVSTLELQLGRLSKDSAEENWQLRQRMASLDAERKALEREKQFHREQMERDEKRVEELKAIQLADTERLQLELQQERSQLAVERQQLQLRHKLQEHGGSFDQDRLELEAQLKVAREAIRRADQERDRCHKLQREVEARKRQLADKENDLNLKEDELAQSTGAYRMATSRTQMAEQKAREADQLLQAKLQLLGKRHHDLSEKEAQLSQERMLLAQDRIAMHNLKKQILRSRCALCKMGSESAELALRIDRKSKNATNMDLHLPPMPLSNAEMLLHMEPGEAQSDIVDRMLDDNIKASYRRMYNVSGSDDVGYGLAGGLDDDSKVAGLSVDNNGKLTDPELEALLSKFKHGFAP
ncbi:trichohyalin [Drosophila guanche]|uniref:Blast:Fas-binding factor 1 n=1 Tax=Drosophila guanche TaxID=7266 RepID=A0A3B0J556_DROGU|nr:trichohyalin [Drosophila guanche]SPP76755.1 blast:Fas-binding factor 1 [Drosophila guanche]